MASLALGVKFIATSSGTGDFVYASASAGYVGPAATLPAMVDGKTYRYRAESADLTQWEFGSGVYTASSQTIARTTITLSSTGAKVSFTAAPTVGVVPFPLDILQFDDAMSLTATQQAQGRANLGVLGRNRIINGQFAVNQRLAGGGVLDNAYSADRWRILTEAAGGVNVFMNNFGAAGGNVPSGTVQFIGTTDKGGLFQVFEGINCKDLRGKSVTLSMLMLVNNVRLGNMKIGVLEWTGTEDATTADPISAWGADGVTPTPAAGWAFKNTPANLSVTTSSASYSTTVTLGSTFTNLAVAIWNDDKVYSANDNFSVTNVQLEEGGVATSFDQRLYSHELSLCQRYLPVAGGSGSVGNNDLIGQGDVFGTTIARIGFRFNVQPRIQPTGITVNNVANFTLIQGSGVNNAATAITLGGAGLTGAQLNVTTTPALTNAAAAQLLSTNTNALILFTGAEL